MRLDLAIAARFPELSRRKARDLIARRLVLVNDRPVAVASREVGASDRITLVSELPEIEVLRETAEWIAVNKPAGLPTQPVRGRDRTSLEEILRLRHRSLFVVHRIDTQTSGVVVFAKTRAAAAKLSALFASRAIRKTYLAVVEGTIERTMTIDAPIAGRAALTTVHPLRALGETTLIEARILTGRTHQIRIHVQGIGHPVAGDRRYGSVLPGRMLLHAWRIEHSELDGPVEAPPPPDFPRP